MVRVKSGSLVSIPMPAFVTGAMTNDSSIVGATLTNRAVALEAKKPGVATISLMGSDWEVSLKVTVF